MGTCGVAAPAALDPAHPSASKFCKPVILLFARSSWFGFRCKRRASTAPEIVEFDPTISELYAEQIAVPSLAIVEFWVVIRILPAVRIAVRAPWTLAPRASLIFVFKLPEIPTSLESISESSTVTSRFVSLSMVGLSLVAWAL